MKCSTPLISTDSLVVSISICSSVSLLLAFSESLELPQLVNSKTEEDNNKKKIKSNSSSIKRNPREILHRQIQVVLRIKIVRIQFSLIFWIFLFRKGF